MTRKCMERNLERVCIVCRIISNKSRGYCGGGSKSKNAPPTRITNPHQTMIIILQCFSVPFLLYELAPLLLYESVFNLTG